VTMIYTYRMASSGILRRVALVRTNVSKELSTSFIRMTRISELGTTLAVTSTRRTCEVPPKHRFLQEPHGVTSQKTPFFIVTTVKTSNLTTILTLLNGDIRCVDMCNKLYTKCTSTKRDGSCRSLGYSTCYYYTSTQSVNFMKISQLFYTPTTSMHTILLSDAYLLPVWP
jgi:hypothetical protein